MAMVGATDVAREMGVGTIVVGRVEDLTMLREKRFFIIISECLETWMCCTELHELRV